MNPGIILAIAGGIGAFFAALAAAASTGPRERPEPPEPVATGGIKGVREIFDRMVAQGAPPDIVGLVLWQAMTESGGNPLVGLGTPSHKGWPSYARPNLKASAKVAASETAAARRAYEKEQNRKWASKSPVPKDHWTFGSGGLYGFLPITALYPLRGTAALESGEIAPHDVFDAYRATAMYVDYIRRVMRLPHFRDLPREHQNALAIKRAGAALTYVKDYKEETDRAKSIRRKMEKAARSLGLPESYFTNTLTADWSRWDLQKAIEAE